MKRIIAALALLASCATTPSWISRPNTEAVEREKRLNTPYTTHDYCVDNAEHYASYEECYSERTGAQALREEKKARAVEAWQRAWTPKPQTNCTSTMVGNTMTTNCQ